MRPSFFITTEQNKMDFSVIHGYLSQSYWSKGIPEATLKKAMANSLCFAVLTDKNEQVGFARVITDYATYAYLADVFVIEAYRGNGLSKELVDAVKQHPELQGLRRITLATRDAHGLYSQYGFSELANPQTFMEIWQPEVYQRDKS